MKRPTLVLAGLALALLAAIPGRAQGPEPARFDWFEYAGDDTTFNFPAGLSEYRNPVLSGFYSDPSITRVGDDYYLTASTFTYFPGLPVFRSRDLVHWTQIGNAIDRPGQLNFDGLGLSRGVFAPSISHHGGTFYIVNTCVDCGGNFIITAKNAAGPWSDPVWIKDVSGIDPSLFVDEDGTAWLMNNAAPAGPPLYEGHRAIWIRRFDLKTLRTSGPARMIVDGGVDISQKPIWAEGPHIFKRDGRYYLITAEGGTAINHSQVVYRGDSPEGPWTAYPRPILTQRDLEPLRRYPVTSAGHADIVETQNGEWWATFLAIRPYGDDLYNTGRETFLLPVHWRDGWPIITAPGQAVAPVVRYPDLPREKAPAIPTSGNFVLREEFGGKALAPYWMTPRVPKSAWHRLRAGTLELTPRAQRIGEKLQPSFIARRQQHLAMTASTSLRFAAPNAGDKAGLAVYQDDAHYYFIGIVNDGGRRVLRVERRAGPGDPVDGAVLASAPLADDAPVRLRIAARGGRYDFSYGTDAQNWTKLLGDADGTILSTRIAGGFVGAMIGPYAHSPSGSN
jgi:xylan 1,4-beta-xylosidase